MQDYTFGNAFQIAKKKQANPAFNPEGDGYDYEIANMLIQKYPLTTPKPNEYVGDEVGNDEAFERWVWHPELNDYLKHGASFNPETGMLLKGLKHKTFNLTQQGEDKLGNEIYKGKDNRYYSRKIAKRAK
jgi:hypothetical protein